MKKILAMLLALVMLLSLCACSNGAAPETEPSEDITLSTDASADGNEETTEESQDATEGSSEPASAPTEGPAPTEGSTPAETPAPVGCSHNWSAATCTAAKTCTKCGATEGAAAGHNWNAATCTAAKTCTKCGATEGAAAGHNWNAATCAAPKTCTKCGATEGAVIGHNYANGACTMCGAAAPKSAFDEFNEGVWKCEVVKPADAENCERYFVVTYDPGWGFGYSYKTYFGKLRESEGGEGYQDYFGTVVYNGKTYYDTTFSGSMGGWTPTELANGNVKIEMMNEVTLEVKRDAPGKFSIVSINDPTFLPVGAVLNKTGDAEME